MISGGFQNYLHLMYGLPNGFLKQADTSDILAVGLKKRRRREEELVEEAVAAQLLQARQREVEIPEAVNKAKLSEILRNKMYASRQGEVAGAERIKRIRLLLLVLSMDD